VAWSLFHDNSKVLHRSASLSLDASQSQRWLTGWPRKWGQVWASWWATASGWMNASIGRRRRSSLWL